MENFRAQSQNLAVLNLGATNPGSVDVENGVIYGASVMTIGPLLNKGQVADLKSLNQVLAACQSHGDEGVKFSIDHSECVLSGVGTVKNFRLDDDQLRGDIYLFDLPEKTRILLLAKNLPNACGLSVETTGTPEPIPNMDIKYYRCSTIQAISLVSIAAGNRALFSAAKIDKKENAVTPKKIMEPEELSKAIAAAVKPYSDKIDELTNKLSAYSDEVSKLKASKEADDNDDDEDNDEEEEAKLSAKITAAVTKATEALKAEHESIALSAVSKFAATIGAKTAPSAVEVKTESFKAVNENPDVQKFNAKVEELTKKGVKNPFISAANTFPNLYNAYSLAGGNNR